MLSSIVLTYFLQEKFHLHPSLVCSFSFSILTNDNNWLHLIELMVARIRCPCFIILFFFFKIRDERVESFAWNSKTSWVVGFFFFIKLGSVMNQKFPFLALLVTMVTLGVRRLFSCCPFKENYNFGNTGGQFPVIRWVAIIPGRYFLV